MVIGAGLLAVLAVIQVVRQWPDPPVEAMRDAGTAIREARKAEAGKYAPRTLDKAICYYDSALAASRIENSRFFLNRDYSRVARYAGLAADYGRKACESATDKARNVHHTTRATLSELEEQTALFRALYSPLPIPKKVRQEFNRAVMLISEARLAREKSDFHIAEEKLSKAKEMADRSEDLARAMLENYFSGFEGWKTRVDDALARSARERSTVVIVDKLARRCRVYQSGKLKQEFETEFGPNWMGQKLQKGDKATPEGSYRVTEKKDRRKTVYYKALMLDYPNQEDRVRFRNNVTSGRISGRQEIGGLIEIHGHGGKGVDWTNGCVALSDKDMDLLYSLVAVKTPVIIVGSTLPLDQYLLHARNQ